MRNCPGILLASPLDRHMRPNANGIFQPQVHAVVGRIFEGRRRHAGSPVFVLPQDIDPSHQRDSELAPFFAHTCSIGKKLRKPNPSFVFSVPSVLKFFGF